LLTFSFKSTINQVDSGFISFFQNILPKKYAKLALKLAQIRVYNKPGIIQKIAQDINVINVQGKNTNGLIVYKTIYINGHQNESEIKL